MDGDMTMDEWELLAKEFDHMLKEAGDQGMTFHEFQERMSRLTWEWEQLKELEEKLRKEKPE
jgi:hypothetical protein